MQWFPLRNFVIPKNYTQLPCFMIASFRLLCGCEKLHVTRFLYLCYFSVLFTVGHVLSLQYMSYLPLSESSLPRDWHSGVSRIRGCLENGRWAKQYRKKKQKKYGWADDKMEEIMIKDKSFRFRKACVEGGGGLISLWSVKQEIKCML